MVFLRRYRPRGRYGYHPYKRAHHAMYGYGSSKSRSIVPRYNQGYLGAYSGIKYSRPKLTYQMKYIDSIINDGETFGISVSGAIIPFTAETGSPSENAETLLHIAQGTGYNQRIANTVIVKAIKLAMQVFVASAAAAGDVVRVCLILDKQPNGATPTIGDIFQYSNINSYQNVFYMDRFKFLIDETFALNPPTATTGGDPSGPLVLLPYFVEWKRYKKCNIPVRYSSVDGTLSEVQSNNLIMACFSLNANSSFSLTSSARVDFIDRP